MKLYMGETRVRKWPSLDGSHSWQNGQMVHILLPNLKLNQIREKSFTLSDLVCL